VVSAGADAAIPLELVAVAVADHVKAKQKFFDERRTAMTGLTPAVVHKFSAELRTTGKVPKFEKPLLVNQHFRSLLGLNGSDATKAKFQSGVGAPAPEDTSAGDRRDPDDQQVKKASSEVKSLRRIFGEVAKWCKKKWCGFSAVGFQAIMLLVTKLLLGGSGVSVALPMRRSKPSHQSSTDAPCVSPEIKAILMMNQFRITMAKADGSLACLGYGLALKGNSMLMPYHFRQQLADQSRDLKIEMSPLVQKYSSIEMTTGGLMDLLDSGSQIEGKDGIIICIPGSYSVKDLTGFFVKASDEVIIARGYRACLTRQRGAFVSCDSGPGSMTGRIGHLDRKEFSYSSSISYAIPCEPGDCGSAIMIDNQKRLMNRIIAGIHTYGITGMATAGGILITQEEIFKALAKLEGLKAVKPALPGTPDDIDLQGGGFGVSRVSPVFLPGETKIRESPLSAHLDAPRLKRPAGLRAYFNDEGKKVKPDVNFRAELNTPIVVLPEAQVKASVHHGAEALSRSTAEFSRVDPTFEQAVSGYGRVKGISSVTSPGYDGMVSHETRYDVLFTTSSDGSTIPCPIKLEKYKSTVILPAIAKLRRGERIAVLYVDMPKDELRSCEKWSKGLTRYVSMCTLEFQILFRMYFGAFLDAVAGTAISNNTSLGINPVGNDWREVAKHLSFDGGPVDHVASGDFTGYDKSQNAQWLWAIHDYIQSWYGEFSIEREMLWYEVANSYHVAREASRVDVVYEWVKGMPSGNPATTVINSIYTLSLISFCWGSEFGFGADDMASMKGLVKPLANGDDSLVSFHPSVVSRFNQNTIAKHLKRAGFVYTCEASDAHDKGGVFPDSRPLSEVSFLKRGFREEKGRLFAPLALSTIIQRLHWQKPNSTLEDDVRDSLLELSYHDTDTWNKYQPIIVKAARAARVVPLECEDRKIAQLQNAVKIPSWFL
jgi:hypothetical protein